MKMIMICDAQVPPGPEMKYDSKGFDREQRRLAESRILESSPLEYSPLENSCLESGRLQEAGSLIMDTKGRPVYISTAGSARETAHLLFGDIPLKETFLLNEIPLRSFRDTQSLHSLRFWRFMAVLQWCTGSKRQEETRSRTQQRARELISFLQKKEEDCILISHKHFLGVLIRELDGAG